MSALRSPWAVAGLAALLGLLLLLPGLGHAPFDDPGEGQHAEIAREAGASGNLLDLRLNGVRYFDKPPLLYWLIALDFRVWGPSEWAARLPSVVGAAAAAAAIALLGARLLGPGAGLLAAAALLSCALFIAFGRYVRPETLFAATVQIGLTGLLLGVTGEGRDTRRWALAGCAGLGLASLAKDPLGLVAPLAAVAAALAACGRLRPVRRWLPPAGLALMLIVGLGWYVWSDLSRDFGDATILELAIHCLRILVLYSLSLVGTFVFVGLAMSFLLKQRGVICEHVLEITDEGLVERTEMNRTLHTWSSICRIMNIFGYLFVYVGDQNSHQIPRRCIPPEQMAVFEGELRARAEAAR